MKKKTSEIYLNIYLAWKASKMNIYDDVVEFKGKSVNGVTFLQSSVDVVATVVARVRFMFEEAG